MASKLWKISSFATSFILAALFVVGSAEWALWRAQSPSIETSVSLMPAVKTWHDATRHDYGHERIALLGDSKLMAPFGQLALPDAVQNALRQSGRSAAHMRVHAFPWSALGVAGHYCVADAIVHANPDRIVFELNLQLWGPAQSSTVNFSELSGFIEGPRLWEAAWLPMSYTGITLNRLLFYRLLMITGLHDFWSTLSVEQGRIYKLREPVEGWLEWNRDSLETEPIVRWRAPLYRGRVLRVLLPGKLRDTAPHARAVLGNVLRGLEPSDARVRVFRALMEAYRRAGIPTLVWVTPLNVEHLQALGIPLDGVDRSIETLRSVVEGSGASFMDFHARFPDTAFVDSGDHFTTAGDPNVSQILGNEIAAEILKMPPAPDTVR